MKNTGGGEGLRISVGSEEQMEICLKQVEEIVGK